MKTTSDMQVTTTQVLAEFDRIKSQCYEFSDPELCILVGANLSVDYIEVQRLVKERAAFEREAA
jgi:hypothetical protein